MSAPVPALQRWRRRRRLRALLPLLGLLVTGLMVPGWLERLDVDPVLLRSMPGEVAQVLATRYLPPDFSVVATPGFLAALAGTLHVAVAATALGLLLAVPLAWAGAGNLRPAGRVLQWLARLAAMVCRSVHEMVWVIAAVTVLGFGLLPGLAAMTLFCTGFAARLMAEALEAADGAPLQALRAAGASPWQLLRFAAWPQVRVAWTGIALYSWDVVFRAATIIGFFGAGGIGEYLHEAVQRVESRQVSAIVLVVVAMVLVGETLSALARARVGRASG